MFELIGLLTVWVFGLGASFVAPIIASGTLFRTGDGLSDLAMGVFLGKSLAAAYLVGTFVYLAAT